MSLTSLQIGISGLHTARRAMEVVSENIANVNTDSYSRRRVEQSVKTRLGPMQGELPREIEAGVEVTAVSRARNLLLDATYRTNAANTSGAQVRADVAARAEEVLGPIDGGAQDALNGFWAAWERLGTRPDDLAARQEVLAAGERLASSLRIASQTLHQVKADVAFKNADLVRDVNNYAVHIANLNAQIGDAVFRGTAPNDLFDQRDDLLDKLAKLTSITVVDAEGRASVYVGSYPLVDGATPQQMVLTPGGSGPVWGINGFPVDLSGELAAVNEALTLTIPGIQSQLDTIANELMSVMNLQHRAGMDLSGAGGGDFFNGGGAADIQLTAGLTAARVAAGLTSAPADNRNALEIAKLGNLVTVSGKSVNDRMSELAGGLGTNAATTEQMAKALGATLAGIDDQRSSITGVNLDEELSDLLRYQRAYEASARVMTAADEMLDVLINRTGLVGR